MIRESIEDWARKYGRVIVQVEIYSTPAKEQLVDVEEYTLIASDELVRWVCEFVEGRADRARLVVVREGRGPKFEMERLESLDIS